MNFALRQITGCGGDFGNGKSDFGNTASDFGNSPNDFGNTANAFGNQPSDLGNIYAPDCPANGQRILVRHTLSITRQGIAHMGKIMHATRATGSA